MSVFFVGDIIEHFFNASRFLSPSVFNNYHAYECRVVEGPTNEILNYNPYRNYNTVETHFAIQTRTDYGHRKPSTIKLQPTPPKRRILFFPKAIPVRRSRSFTLDTKYIIIILYTLTISIFKLKSKYTRLKQNGISLFKYLPIILIGLWNVLDVMSIFVNDIFLGVVNVRCGRRLLLTRGNRYGSNDLWFRRESR